MKDATFQIHLNQLAGVLEQEINTCTDVDRNCRLQDAKEMLRRAFHLLDDTYGDGSQFDDLMSVPPAPAPDLSNGGYLSLRSQYAEITIEPRPPHCQRGRFYAKLFVFDATPGGYGFNMLHTWDASQTGCPRYYFDLAAAQAECVAFLKANDDQPGDWITKP